MLFRSDHIERLSADAVRGRDYTITLPLARDGGWLPEFEAYWREFGSAVGSVVPAAPNSTLSTLADVRAIRIPAARASHVSVADLNIVTQRLDAPPFDLVVGTNVFVYYGPLDQALALANATSMLREGGLLLSNTVLPEVKALPVDVADLTTISYTQQTRKDVIVSYRVRRN